MIGKTMYTENKDYYGVVEVSQLFGVSQATVRNMIKDGRLDAEKVGKGYQITADSIKHLVREGSNKE